MFIPSAFIIRKSLKTALLVASGAMALGTTLRAAFLTDPEGNPGQFTIFCHICAVLNDISSPLLGCGTMLLGCLWFPQDLNNGMQWYLYSQAIVVHCPQVYHSSGYYEILASDDGF